jgi:hypothetical protein
MEIGFRVLRGFRRLEGWMDLDLLDEFCSLRFWDYQSCDCLVDSKDLILVLEVLSEGLMV